VKPGDGWEPMRLLKKAGFTHITFIDAMTNHIGDEELASRLAGLKPDVIGVTAITPSIYKAEKVLGIARDACPQAVRVLGGVHATFMYKQVLSEAPWVDVIVRGEGEEIFTHLVTAIAEGRWPQDRSQIKGLAFRDGEKIVATQAAPTVKDFDAVEADWSMLEWEKYIYVPLGVRVAIPNMARGCPFTCSFCSQWKFWRDYRVRDPKKVVDEIEKLVNEHQVGFFILADEEPTINRKKFIQFCEELIARGLPVGCEWIPDEELRAKPELVKSMSVSPPLGFGRVRLVRIAEVDLQPCGGTHVRNTSEIGAVRVAKIEKKSARTRRVVLEFA